LAETEQDFSTDHLAWRSRNQTGIGFTEAAEDTKEPICPLITRIGADGLRLALVELVVAGDLGAPGGDAGLGLGGSPAGKLTGSMRLETTTKHTKHMKGTPTTGTGSFSFDPDFTEGRRGRREHFVSSVPL